jgi:hypothetical protein
MPVVEEFRHLTSKTVCSAEIQKTLQSNMSASSYTVEEQEISMKHSVLLLGLLFNSEDGGVMKCR